MAEDYEESEIGSITSEASRTNGSSAGGRGSKRDPSEAANCTDLGNARRFIQRYGHVLRYCPQQRRWYVWTGFYWRADATGEVERFAKTLPWLIAEEAIGSAGESRKQKLQWSISSESAYRIKSAIGLAKTEPGMPIQAAELDPNPLLLGVRNGVVDLITGLLVAAEQTQLITKQAGVAFDSGATCPKWDSFIRQITGVDEELALFLQRVAGYLLTGRISEQCFFVLVGGGANGKSVFLGVMQDLFGDYACATPPETLLVRREAGGARPDLARLRGARLVVASEPSDNSVLEEALVKRLTGQDKIVCRDLYSSLIEYVPTFKFVLATNSKPVVHGTDHAIWRRIHLIPFNVTFRPHEQDKQLIAKLTAELPGILNWALNGTLAYLENGLNPPSSVVAATQSYRSEMDVLEEWIEDECVRDTASQTLVTKLYDAYSRWCQKNKLRQLMKRTFGDQLEAKGFERARGAGGARLHRGIALRGGVT